MTGRAFGGGRGKGSRVHGSSHSMDRHSGDRGGFVAHRCAGSPLVTSTDRAGQDGIRAKNQRDRRVPKPLQPTRCRRARRNHNDYQGGHAVAEIGRHAGAMEPICVRPWQTSPPDDHFAGGVAGAMALITNDARMART